MKKLFLVSLLMVIIFNAKNYSHNSKFDESNLIKEKNELKSQSKMQNDKEFTSFWNQFVDIVSATKIDNNKLGQISLKILDIEEKKIQFGSFVKNDLIKIFDKRIKVNIRKENLLSFYESDLEAKYFKGLMIKDLKSFKIKKVSVIKNNDKNDGNPEILELCFVETKNGYKFLGLKRYG